jgi:hypothetical protein
MQGDHKGRPYANLVGATLVVALARNPNGPHVRTLEKGFLIRPKSLRRKTASSPNAINARASSNHVHAAGVFEGRLELDSTG